MSNVKKQNTLFRFLNLRSPELSKKESQDDRFIFQELTSGVHYKGIAETTKPEIKRATTEKAAEEHSYRNEKELKSDYPEDFYSVSEWIAQNKFNLSIEEALEKIENLEELDRNAENNLWKQLFSQITHPSSLYVKEGIMHLLTLQHILKRRKKINDIHIFSSKLRTLAQAKIVIPPELFKREKGNQRNKKPQPDPVSNKELIAAQQKEEAKSKIETFQTYLSLLERQTEKIQAEYQESYAQAEKEYQKTIQPLLDKYQKQCAEEEQKLNKLALDEGKNPNTLFFQPSTELPKLPEFSFKPLGNILSLLLEKLSNNDLKAYLTSAIEKYQIDTIDEVFKLLKKEIEAEYKTITQYTPTSKPVSVIGNMPVPLGRKLTDLDTIPFRYNTTIGSNESLYYIHMYIILPDKDFLFSGTSYTITSKASINNIQKFSYNYNEDQTVLHLLFYTNNSQNISQQITGTIDFENGSQYTFEFETALGSSLNGYLTKNKDSEENDPVEAPSGFGITQLGIADYKKVVSEVICYDPGEVSHIENIMAREYKERSTKKFHQTQTSITESSETESEKLSDTNSVERFEMQSEIAKIIQEQKNVSVNTNAQYKSIGFSIDLGAGYATTNSKEDSNRQVLTEAKELTQRAMERIVSKIKKETSTKVTNEFTEESKHGFDNRKGDHHVSGVYRFINAIYKNQIYNYGKRLMYEFLIPQPSKFHSLWLGNSKAENISTIDKPIDPRKCGLSNFSVLNEYNYMDWAAKYNAEVEAYPEKELSLGESFSGNASGEVDRIEYFSGKDKIEIPDGYKATKAYVTINAADNDDKRNGKGVLVNIGNTKVSETTKAALVNYSSEVLFKTKFEKFIPFSVTFANYFSGSITISILCMLSESAQSKWQIETFNSIMNAYQNQLDEYNSKLSDIKTENEARLAINPMYYRQIEQTALQKNCISYLLNNVEDMGKQMYSGDKLENYTLNISEELDKYGNFAKFMEQAFEWDMMSYTFYPFYWGYKGDWNELYQFDCNDPLFKSFMQAGLARVVVTVKPGFEDAIMHYMETGQIWNGGEIPVIGNPLYLSIVDELKEQEYVIEETWETVVPTSLIALQNSGVVIDSSGLPCFHKDGGKGTLTTNSKKIGDSDSEKETQENKS